VVNYWLSGLCGLGMDLFYGQNDIVPIIIWQRNLHESCRHLSQLPTQRKMSSFGLLEPEIWTEH
jgi:hypothetical protein